MDRIYRRANVVYAWLGEEDDGSANAMELLQILQKLFFETPGNYELVLRSESFAMGWESLIPLLRRPYWTRAWIVQEVLLAENVMLCCGKHQVSWPALGVLLLHIIPSWHSEFLRSPDNESVVLSIIHTLSYLSQEVGFLAQFSLKYQLLISETSENERPSFDFLECLTMSRRRVSTDERDYIYSILSLTDITFLRPTYKKSTSWLFKELVVRDIKARGNISILCGCKHFSEDERNESWFSQVAKIDLDRNEDLSKELERGRLSSTSPLAEANWGHALPIWYEKTRPCLESWYEKLMDIAPEAGKKDIRHGNLQHTTMLPLEMLSSALGFNEGSI